jgi:hypothetical protein
METKNQTLKISKKSGMDKKLRYDYSELDEFFDSEIELNDLIHSYKRINHSMYINLLLLISNKIGDIPETLMSDNHKLDRFFSIVEKLKENKD